jgi:hypothetical protein
MMFLTWRKGRLFGLELCLNDRRSFLGMGRLSVASVKKDWPSCIDMASTSSTYFFRLRNRNEQ